MWKIDIHAMTIFTDKTIHKIKYDVETNSLLYNYLLNGDNANAWSMINSVYRDEYLRLINEEADKILLEEWVWVLYCML